MAVIHFKQLTPQSPFGMAVIHFKQLIQQSPFGMAVIHFKQLTPQSPFGMAVIHFKQLTVTFWYGRHTFQTVNTTVTFWYGRHTFQTVNTTVTFWYEPVIHFKQLTPVQFITIQPSIPIFCYSLKIQFLLKRFLWKKKTMQRFLKNCLNTVYLLVRQMETPVHSMKVEVCHRSHRLPQSLQAMGV